MASTQKQMGMRLSDEMRMALQRVKDETGVPISVQVRKALEAWIAVNGVPSKSERKRPASRKRS